MGGFAGTSQRRAGLCCVAGGGFTCRRGTFGSVGKLETMMSVAYGRAEELVFSGAATGDIFIWKDTLLLRTVKAHDGPVFAMHALDKVSGSFLRLDLCCADGF